VDNPRSWILSFVQTLIQELKERRHVVHFYQQHNDVGSGDILFILSCDCIVSTTVLQKHSHNIVIHPSDLPHGRGFSPLTWQIIEGKSDIPITLFEAVEKVDAGPIYFKDIMRFEGHELNDELKAAQGKKTIELALRFVDAYPHVTSQEQTGQGSWYARRRRKDSEIDVNKTLAEQFNLLRVVDNERYPAFFVRNGSTYVIKIFKEDRNGGQFERY
jgi:methionyl-tRNA formyltransferase